MKWPKCSIILFLLTFTVIILFNKLKNNWKTVFELLNSWNKVSKYSEFYAILSPWFNLDNYINPSKMIPIVYELP